MGWEQFAVNGEGESHLIQEIHQKGTTATIGRDAKYEMGINYVGGWETMHAGVSIAVRKHACALRAAGLPVFLQSESYTHMNYGVSTTVEYSKLPEPVLNEVGHVTHLDHADTAIVIRHTVPTQPMLEAIVSPGGARFMSGATLDVHRRRTVLYAAFEENAIPKGKVRLLNLLGQIWTPSVAARTWLLDSGVQIPIKVIPHPFSDDDPMSKIEPKERGKSFRFLNISKWEPRKGQHDLIGGFLLAFKPNDPVQLVIKSDAFCMCDNYPLDWRDSIRAWLGVEEIKGRGWSQSEVDKHILVIWNTVVSRETLAQMYAESDVYVSCGRSEGFDLPAFDAKLAHRRLVHPDNGAAWDYAQKNDIAIQHKGHDKFHPWYGFKNATWPDFDANDVCAALLKAFNTKDIAQGLSREAFSMEVVGKLMREACEEIAPELSEVHE